MIVPIENRILRISRMALLSFLAPIDIPAMTDAKDKHDQLFIMDPEDDPVLAHSNPIEIVLPLELDRASGSWTDGELVDTRGDPPLDGSRRAPKLSAG
jgi:hypothetical protein